MPIYQEFRTHNTEKPSKISHIYICQFAFLSKKKKNLKLNIEVAILSTLEPTTLDESIRCTSKLLT